jgi:hypothetical protein
MELKKTDGKIGGCVLYAWTFTKDEREQLEAALSKFPEEEVQAFTWELETFCICTKIYLRERDVTFHRAEKSRMLRRFEKTREELLRLVDHKIKTQENKDVLEIALLNRYVPSMSSEMSRALAAFTEEQERLYYLMLSTATSLQEIMGIIKDRPRAPGRPSVEDATGDLVTLIARSFAHHFEKPTGYQSRKQTGVPFFSVVQLALKACGLPSEDPSRHIKAALKSL